MDSPTLKVVPHYTRGVIDWYTLYVNDEIVYQADSQGEIDAFEAGMRTMRTMYEAPNEYDETPVNRYFP